MNSATLLAERLVDTLPSDLPGLFNPWVDQCTLDFPHNSPEAKLARLAAHLDCEPKFILCGEAPGYQGCRHTGVAFTSEKLILAGAIPRVSTEQSRLTRRQLPFSEPSATIIWENLIRLKIEERTVLWNAVQLHPYRIWESHSNRTPTDSEIGLGKDALLMLAQAFPCASIIAVGRKAEKALTDARIPIAARIRHPANGGARRFADELALAVSETGVGS